jgi:hypothetical protein
MIIYPGKVRKDGKILVTLVFPVLNKRQRVVWTKEKLKEEQEKQNNK